MPASIFGDRFVGVRAPAWHGLGTVLPEPIPALEAVRTYGMDYSIRKCPLAYDWNGVPLPTGDVALVREPVASDNQPRVLGHAGPDYGLLQNTEVAELLDRYLTPTLPLETVGALGQGETIFFALDAGTDDILPNVKKSTEQVRSFFLLTDTRTGGRALQIAYTPVRVVCGNTLISGLSAATVKWSVVHDKAFRQNVEDQAHILGSLEAARKNVLAAMRKMALTKIVDDQVDAILKAAYPHSDPPGWVKRIKSLEELGVKVDAPEQVARLDRTVRDVTVWNESRDELRASARELFTKLNDEHPAIARTSWAAYNAVVECEDYRVGRRDEVVTAASAVFGDRAKAKAAAFKVAASFN